MRKVFTLELSVRRCCDGVRQSGPAQRRAGCRSRPWPPFADSVTRSDCAVFACAARMVPKVYDVRPAEMCPNFAERASKASAGGCRHGREAVRKATQALHQTPGKRRPYYLHFMLRTPRHLKRHGHVARIVGAVFCCYEWSFCMYISPNFSSCHWTLQTCLDMQKVQYLCDPLCFASA